MVILLLIILAQIFHAEYKGQVSKNKNALKIGAVHKRRHQLRGRGFPNCVRLQFSYHTGLPEFFSVIFGNFPQMQISP